MMRILLPIVLLSAACGDNVFDPELEGPPVENEPPGWESVEPHFAPDVCSARSWPSVPFTDRDVDLTVVPTSTGAAIFSVDRAGGPLRGFAIDDRGELVTKEQGNIIRDDHMFTAVSAAYIDERLITAAVTDEGSVVIDMIRPDLGATANLSTARGTMVADLPIAHAREDRLATVAASDGVLGIRFDTAWRTSGTQMLTTSAPRTITATRHREDTMVVWSTDSACHSTRVAAEINSTNNSFACLNARVALNQAEGTGFMVFEAGADKIMISKIRIRGEREIEDARLLLDNARAPKITFDGSRYWISYINVRQDVVVGYLDAADGSLRSMALEGTQPNADAYDLAVLSGAVWVFAVDGAGAGAQRLCLKPVR